MEIFTSTETIGRRKERCVHNVYIMYKVASGISVQLYNSCTVRRIIINIRKEWGRKREEGDGRGKKGGMLEERRKEKERARKGQGREKEGGRKGFHGIYQGVGVDYI